LDECGLTSYTLRRTKADGDFINGIKQTFNDAAKNEPSVILLDDMDKFVSEEGRKEEFSVVQACIDEVKGKQVFVIATANSTRDMPSSLTRAGRFDRKIEVKIPSGQDAVDIVHYYLKSKTLDEDVDFTDVAKMMSRKSCAELGGVINEAAIYAGFERSEKVCMRHLVRAFLRTYFRSNEAAPWEQLDEKKRKKLAYHEAGHAAVAELLKPNSVGIISIHSGIEFATKGFVGMCERIENDEEQISLSIAGKVVSEMMLGEIDEGAFRDMERAIFVIREELCDKGFYGMDLVTHFKEDMSETKHVLQENCIRSELERQRYRVMKLLTEHRTFFDLIAKELMQKETLLYSDMQRIRKEYFNEKEQ
jgi:cell division protease FtsH